MVEDLPLLLAIFSIAVSIVYYALELRNANNQQKMEIDNRNAQFYLQIVTSTWYDEGIQQLFSDSKWNSFDEWCEMYNPETNPKGFTDWFKGMMTMEIYGVLVKRGIITIDLIDDMMSGYVLWAWDTYGHIIEEMRQRFGYPQLQEHQEYLSEEIRKIVAKQHPDYRGRKINR